MTGMHVFETEIKSKWIEKYFDKEKEETFQWRLLFGHNVYMDQTPKKWKILERALFSSYF